MVWRRCRTGAILSRFWSAPANHYAARGLSAGARLARRHNADPHKPGLSRGGAQRRRRTTQHADRQQWGAGRRPRLRTDGGAPPPARLAIHRTGAAKSRGAQAEGQICSDPARVKADDCSAGPSKSCAGQFHQSPLPNRTADAAPQRHKSKVAAAYANWSSGARLRPWRTH